MIARFHILLPFDLFITDEEQLAFQADVSDPEMPSARLTIPTTWGYAERPDPTGTMHEVIFEWLYRAEEPVFSEDCYYDGCRIARVNILVFEFTANDFNRAQDRLLKPGPFIEYAYEVANLFLSRLRVYARLPQVRMLLPIHDPWMVQFLSDDRVLLPEEDGKLREARGGSVNVGVFAFKTDAVKTVSEKWDGPEPYVWDQLLLDAQYLWPNIGSSIVTAYSALETFIAWALEILQSTNNTFPEEAWKWIKNRGNFLKDPSVEEQYDTLLCLLGTKSLKSEQALWTSFKALKDARNNLVHEGLAKSRRGELIDASKAKILISDAEKIIEWVEGLLPSIHQRHSRRLTNQATRRFATEEQARLYNLHRRTKENKSQQSGE